MHCHMFYWHSHSERFIHSLDPSQQMSLQIVFNRNGNVSCHLQGWLSCCSFSLLQKGFVSASLSEAQFISGEIGYACHVCWLILTGCPWVMGDVYGT